MNGETVDIVPTIQVLPHARLTPTQCRQILALCSDAYEEDFTPYFELLDTAVHMLAMEDEELVCHAAWISRTLRLGPQRAPLSCAYIEAVATPIRLQRRGLGTLVIRAIPQQLLSFDIAALSPSEPDFYARSGWEMWRGPLYCMKDGLRLSTPDEQVMIHRLPRTPSGLSLTEELEVDWRAGDVW